MRRWFELHPVLRDREDGAGGGSGSDVIRDRVDPGAPHEVGVEHEPADTPATPKKTAAEIQAEDLTSQLASERRRREEAEDDARYWANRNKRTAADADEPLPARRAAVDDPAPVADMTADELVELINKKGVAGLKEAGFLTKGELEANNAALRSELTGFVKNERADAEFGGRVASEFPTIAAESQKIHRAKAQGVRYTPTDPLFIRAGELYREAIADDPALENAQGIILATARMAARELAGGGTRRQASQDTPPRGAGGRFEREETPARRRDRIDRQRPDRGTTDDETGSPEQFDEEQLAVMKHLNVKPEKFVAHRDAAVRQESRRARR